jgi:hypothetical protein
VKSHEFQYKLDGPVSGLMYIIFRISKFFSLGFRLNAYLIKRKPSREDNPAFDTWFFGIYVLAWLGALLVILMWAPLEGNWGLAFAALAFYRLEDMVFGTIGDAFVFNTIGGTGGSKVLLAVINLFQIVVIFAIVFFVLLPRTAFNPPAPVGRFGHLFLSWSTLPPLGSGFLPLTTRARSMVMVESAAGVLITIVALSRFLSAPDLGFSAVTSTYGKFQLVAGGTTISDPAAKPDSRILLTPQDDHTVGTVRVLTREAGRFTVGSDRDTDDGLVAYEIRNHPS